MNETIYEQSAEMHKKARGKLEVNLKVPLSTQDDLSLAYTPGVARPCEIIQENPEAVYDYTWKGNTVAVVTDGTAVLGLGDIGPEASMPVMEGKAALLKEFAGINAIPIPLDTTKYPKEIISIVKAIAPGFGGINLEDISAPRCVEIERALMEELDIPVFHDDQHGTAIVVAAGIINGAKFVRKEIADLTVVVSGAGAAGSSVIKMLHNKLGVREIYAFDINGIIIKDDDANYDFLNQELSSITNSTRERLSLAEAMTRADAFVGVSKAGIVTPEMVKSMKRDPIVFAMANPEPEITYELGKSAGARIMGTGRSDSPNQINNVLAFPGIFRGALDCRATTITEDMKLEAAYAIASLVSKEEMREDYILPKATDKRVVKAVAEAVMATARKQGIARA